MNIEHLIGTMIEGTLSTGRKRSHRAGRFLTGGNRSFMNASTLLTVGGLVWGVIESMQQQPAGQGGTGAAATPAPPLPSPGAPGASAPGTTRQAPPPLPGSVVPPAVGKPSTATAPAIPDGATRLIRLMVSAARADGQASDAEKEAILSRAREVGAEALVEDEWLHPTPLSSVVGVVSDAQQRADLYVLAYTIVRADEGISGAERIYLAQLAGMLSLDKATVDRLEQGTDERIAGSL